MKRAEELIQGQKRSAVVAIEVTMMELVVKASQPDYTLTLN
jgi:hypothetical protein